ncbi:MAG: SixA phosphatase family protein [Dongiaceae bacterium]
MKTLYLFRHAKSSWTNNDAEDFDRPLAPRGRRAAPAMAAHMRKQGYVPDLVLCSPARRTRETAALVQPVLGTAIPLRFDDKLYLASAEHILRQVQAVEDKVRRLLVIGHNPGLQRLAARLADDAHARARLGRKFPTAGLAVFEFDVRQWNDIEAGRLIAFVVPAGLG